MQELHQQWANGELDSTFSIRDGMILCNGRVWVPTKGEIRNQLLREFHDVPKAGYGGVLKTYAALSTLFFWPRMKQDVANHIKNCEVCQTTKYATGKLQGLLQPLSLPTQPWQNTSMDFITQLPRSEGHTAICVVVDRFSKFAHFMPLKPGFTAKIVAQEFISAVVKLHGFPIFIVSDRDPLFLSKFWCQLFKFSRTQLHYSSAYHPQSDGQTEVVNRCLEQYLRAYSHGEPHKWVTHLLWAEFSYNTSFHTAIAMTPFEALYGFSPQATPGYVPGSSAITEVDELLCPGSIGSRTQVSIETNTEEDEEAL